MTNRPIWIPTALTFAGAVSGFVALICLTEERYLATMLWMFLAVLFDGVDGKVASLLDCKSELGATLDSLADVVSFAVLPGAALYLFFRRSPLDGLLPDAAAWVAGAGYVCAGIFREIRFMTGQLDRERGEGFVGLPIAPPAGMIVAATCLANLLPRSLYGSVGQIAMFGAAAGCAYLMTASRIVYLRWGAGAIAAQTLTAAAVGVAVGLGTASPGGALASFYIAFCAVYIGFHPLRAAFRGVTV